MPSRDGWHYGSESPFAKSEAPEPQRDPNLCGELGEADTPEGLKAMYCFKYKKYVQCEADLTRCEGG